MASIEKRTKADGTIVYKASIVIKKMGIIVHRESKTFIKQKLAKDWGLRREVELQETTVYKKRPPLALGKVIQMYLDQFDTGRTKTSDMKKLINTDIAKLNIHTLTSADIIAHVRKRNESCQAQTAGNDLIWMNMVLRTMSGVIELDTDLSIIASAREVLRNHGLIAKSNKRTRRPTRQELWALSKYFGRGHYMLYQMWFAIFSCRRQAEITKIQWADIKHENATCLIRDLKDPKAKNKTRRCKLPKSAYKIIMRQPHSSPIYVFPYNSRTVSANFTRACQVLCIEDLHFHDLRREGTSRLFEAGLSIQQVAQVTLHEQWSTLKIYVNLDPGDLNI